jgi:hypothetical protein
MKKLLAIVVLGLLWSENVFAGKSEMEQAAKSIPGVADAAFQGNSSFWVVMSNPNAGHDFDYYGSMLCNGGQQNFGVAKGYTITFWNAYTKKPIKKFRCY